MPHRDVQGLSLHEWAGMLPEVLDHELEYLHDGKPSLSDVDTLEELAQHVRSVLGETVAGYMHRRNQLQARTECLPIELLQAVFQHLSEKDRISVTHVCQNWRASALKAPSLWSYVFSHDQQPGILTARLARIPSTVSIQLSLELANKHRLNEGISAIRNRLPYARSLYVLVYRELSDLDLLDLFAALSQPAPNLTRLSLVVGNRDVHWHRHPLLAGHAPNLHMFKYFGRVGELSSLPFLWQIRSALVAEIRSSNYSTLVTIFGLFYNAEYLSIHLGEWDALATGIIPISSLSLPRSLRALCIIPDPSGVDIVEVLSLIPHGPVEDFTIRYETPPHLEHDTQLNIVTSVSHAMRSPVERVGFGSAITPDVDGVGTIIIVWTADWSQRRAFYRLALTFRDIVDSFTSLTHLTISDSDLPEDEEVFELPRLTLLSFVLEFPYHHGDNNMFLLPRTNAMRLVCPSLTLVNFSCLRVRKAFLAPNLVSEFIIWHIESNGRLSLSLYNVEILQSNLKDVLALLSLVDICEAKPEEAETGSGTETDLSKGIARLFSWGLEEE